MYHVTLTNLSADARAVVPQAYHEHRDLPPAALQALLRDFCQIDPIENAVADTEIRVQVRRDSYLLRTGQKKLILYDANRRDLPAQVLTVEQAMLELDGSAGLVRSQAILQARAEAGVEPEPAGPELPARPPAAVPDKRRLLAFAFSATGLLAILWLVSPDREESVPENFVPLPTAESKEIQRRLVGVYLAGTEPGQHGIVVTGPQELKLFELGTVEAPRTVYAGFQLGRIGNQLALATDQPGGVIGLTAEGSLVYCGETYQRIP